MKKRQEEDRFANDQLITKKQNPIAPPVVSQKYQVCLQILKPFEIHLFVKHLEQCTNFGCIATKHAFRR
jgi:hypothetical protein